MLDLACLKNRVSIVGLRLLSLKGPVCKVGLWLDSKNLKGKQSP